MEFFIVGGAVRDACMGIDSDDIDFSVVMSSQDLPAPGLEAVDRTPFEILEDSLKSMGFKVFQSRPEFFTIRAHFPKAVNKLSDGMFDPRFFNSGITADFVLSRKESGYSDGRRPDSVELGTLEDDLARRDFTMNAMAQDREGNIIDPFDGLNSILDRRISAVGAAVSRISEDPLRAVRALRFAVTKGFVLDPELNHTLQLKSIADLVASDRLHDDRIRVELSKMFDHDSVGAMMMLNKYPLLTRALFSGKVRLQPTMKER